MKESFHDKLVRYTGYIRTGVAMILYYPAAVVLVISVAIQHDNAEASRVAHDLLW